jgi:hypothetical protein
LRVLMRMLLAVLAPAQNALRMLLSGSSRSTSWRSSSWSSSRRCRYAIP